MATIQIKRFDESGLTPANKGEPGKLAYGELAVNTTDNRMWVGHSDTSVKEITQQIIFAFWDPDDEITHPQPPILRAGQLWYNLNEVTGEYSGKLFVSVQHQSLEWVPVDGSSNRFVRILDELLDVDITSPVEHDVLSYDAAGFWKNRGGYLSDLPDVEASLAQRALPTHGMVLMYDGTRSQWTPLNSPYDGALLSPHSYICQPAASSNPVNFLSASSNITLYNDTAFCIGEFSWGVGDAQHSLEKFKLGTDSKNNGWTETNVKIPNDPDAEGINRYLKIVKKFIGSNDSYSASAEVYGAKNWESNRYGFQVRGNATLEVVKMEYLDVDPGTNNAASVLMSNDANILFVVRHTPGGANLILSGVSPTSNEVFAANPDSGQFNAAFIRKNSYFIFTSILVYVAPGSDAPAWVGGNELLAVQLRVTQGIDEADITNNPAFDFLKGASDKDLLGYDGGTDTWGPVNKPPLGNNALEEIGDVDVTGVADDDVLAWDSANTKWKRRTIEIPAQYIEKQYNYTGPIEPSIGVVRYYLPANISEIRLKPYLGAPSTNGKVGAYLKINDAPVAYSAVFAGETEGEEVVLAASYPKGSYLTVEIVDAGTNAQYLSLLISLKRA